LEPVFAFDREVIPAGTVALGKVSRTQPVRKWQRFTAILNGDFTPLRRAQVEFTTLRLPDGRELVTHTVESMGLNSIYIEPSPKKKKDQKAQPQNPNGGILETAKQTAKDRIKGAIDARIRGCRRALAPVERIARTAGDMADSVARLCRPTSRTSRPIRRWCRSR
jgi:hypothetical protein